MASRLPNPLEPYVCHVGNKSKIIYLTELDAEVAARNAEISHGLPIYSLDFYLCEYSPPHQPHYHLRRTKPTPPQTKRSPEVGV